MSYLRVIVKLKDYFLKLIMFLNRPSLYAWYVFFFFTVYFLLTYMTLDKVFSLDDHFFHIRFAELLREKGMSAFTDFQSIYFSHMGIGHAYFVYYSFLFYLVMLPFTLISPLILGIKLYGVLALSFSFTVIYIFLKKIPVKYPYLWTFLFFIAFLQSGWLVRFTLARPFTLAPTLLVIMLYAVHRKIYWASALMAFLYFYWHTATFMFPFLLAGGYFLFEQFYGIKPDWKKISWPFLGTVAALFLAYVISPGFISYLKDVIFPVFFDTTLSKTAKIAEGGEVYGRNFFTTFNSFFWFLTALFVAGSYEVYRYMRSKFDLLEAEDKLDMSIQPLRLMLFTASFVFLVATTLSSRFLDFFIYFCILYVAIALSDLNKFFEIKGKLFRKSFFTGITLITIYLLASLSLNFFETLSKSGSYLMSQAPAEWLNSHAAKDKIIFNADWDSFPTLYYFTGDRFRYITGLEPRFLYDLNPKLYWIWNNIGNGIYCELPDCSDLTKQRSAALLRDDSRGKWYKLQGNSIADAILANFKTDLIVTSINRKSLLDVMDHSDRFKREFFDDKNSSYAIYRIVAQTDSSS